MDSESLGWWYLTADIIGNLAAIASIMQLSSGIIVCKQYVMNKTTGDASSLPFVSGILFSAIWLLYGHARHCTKLVQVYLVGLILMCGYTTVFFFYTLKKTAVMKQCAAIALFFFLILTRVGQMAFYNRLALITTLFVAMTVADPMRKVLIAINVKNTDCLPVYPILMSLLVTVLWSIYGILIDEIILMVTNIVGAAVALLQLFLIYIYSRKSSTPLLPKLI